MQHQGSNSSNALQRPPEIDNSDLICASTSEQSQYLEIYETLIEGTDYILVPEIIWNQFYEWLV